MNKTQKKNTLIKHLGTLLILLSLMGIVYIYFPIASLYLNPPSINENVLKTGAYIVIPKIKAQAKLIENVDPWNETEYKKALEGGVAHAKGTAKPGEKGMSFLFAHSSEEPWRITRENVAFFRLNELTGGDVVSLYKNGKEYKYKVIDKKEVWPNEVNYLAQTNRNVLILQTCTPIGTSLKRLLVFAEPVSI